MGQGEEGQRQCSWRAEPKSCRPRTVGSPFSRGLGGPAFGQAEVPDVLPSWPLQVLGNS